MIMALFGAGWAICTGGDAGQLHDKEASRASISDCVCVI